MRYRHIENDLHPFVIVQTDGGELRTGWLWSDDDALIGSAVEDTTMLPELADQLIAYFHGEAVDFGHVPLPAGTVFQQQCWAACRAIPRGETWNYAELAEHAGSVANAARAAGQTMRRNPQPIITPCHRVISAAGKLHGFAGEQNPAGERLGLKARLLQLEREPVLAVAG